MNQYQTTLDVGTAGVASITPAAAGIRFATAPTPVTLDDITLTGVAEFTVTADKAFGGFIRFVLPDVDKMGLVFGFITKDLNGTPVAASAPTDGVYLIKTPTGTTFLGRVIENGSAADDSGTLLTASDAGEYILSFYCKPGSTAATSEGWWGVESGGTYTRTAFTANQLAALALMPSASLEGTVQARVSGTTVKYLDVVSCDLWSEK